MVCSDRLGIITSLDKLTPLVLEKKQASIRKAKAAYDELA
jgi:hypothetical protein